MRTWITSQSWISPRTAVRRILIEGVDANDGLDITEFHFKAALPSAYKESVGDFIQFQDDGPQIVAGAAPPTITLDESGLTGGNVIAPDVGITSSTGNFVTAFTASFGVDGQLPGTTTTYSLGTVGGNSGLVDTLTGQTVVLSKDGNDIVGTINSGTTTVIRISVSAAGVVTFTQSRAVEQANPASHDESIALAATANLITLTATVTDGDQDKGSLTRDITSSFVIQDDRPTVALALNAGQQVVVDETIGQNPGENETGSLGSVTVLGTSLFTQTVRFGADGAFDANNDGVADQESKTFALAVNGLDPASGLTDVLTGQAIFLVRNATTGVVEGHVGVAAGALAFTISAGVFTGNITLTQLRAVTHDDPNDPDESTSPAVLNADLVRLTMTVKDGDDDTDYETIDISRVLHL